MTTKKQNWKELARKYIKISPLISDKTDIKLEGGFKSRWAGNSTSKLGGAKKLTPEEESKTKAALGDLADEIKLSLEE